VFADEAKIMVKAGDGGNGCLAFRREKYVPRAAHRAAMADTAAISTSKRTRTTTRSFATVTIANSKPDAAVMAKVLIATARQPTKWS
jgi:hypothetical protein